MSATKSFSEALHEWVKVFMHRSMIDFKRFMDGSELSSTHVNVLMHLYFGGQCDVSDIGTGLGVTNAAASQTVERLVQRGLLGRTEDPLDRRVKQINITSKGRALIEAGIEARGRWMDDLTRVLPVEQQRDIAAALTILTEAAKSTADSAIVNNLP